MNSAPAIVSLVTTILLMAWFVVLTVHNYDNAGKKPPWFRDKIISFLGKLCVKCGLLSNQLGVDRIITFPNVKENSKLPSVLCSLKH